MSDFGAVYEYALQLEGSIPAGAMAEMEAIRPAVMGMTPRQTEEAAKLAAIVNPEERAAAEAKFAAQREEARSKAEDAMRRRVKEAAAAANRPAPTPAPATHPAPAETHSTPTPHAAEHPAPAPHAAANNKK